MSGKDDGEGLAEVFVKGAVFTLGAACVGFVLRKVFRREPEVVVVVAADELPGRGRAGEGEGDEEDDELEVEIEDEEDEDDA